MNAWHVKNNYLNIIIQNLRVIFCEVQFCVHVYKHMWIIVKKHSCTWWATFSYTFLIAMSWLIMCQAYMSPYLHHICKHSMYIGNSLAALVCLKLICTHETIFNLCIYSWCKTYMMTTGITQNKFIITYYIVGNS